MKKFPDNDAFKKINKLVFEFNRRLSYPWTVHFDDFVGTLKLQKVKCDGMLYNAQINTTTYKTYVIFNYDILSETCRSAKAEDLLLKDLTTVPTQGLLSNQYQSAY